VECRSPSYAGHKQFPFQKEKKQSSDSRGIIHKEFLPLSQAVNKEYYSRLVQRIGRVRPQFQEQGR
jgi:hypothetical protein